MTPTTITLMALGDIWLARQVAEAIERHGVDHPFARIASTLQTADVVLGNLESPVSTRGQPAENKEVTARAAPEYLDGLVSAGIHVVTLANNHIMDFGRPALEDTLRFLNARGIRHLGAGLSPGEAARPLLMKVKEMIISFHAYLCWGEDSRRSRGPAGWNRTRVAQALDRARRQADAVIVSLHGGAIFQDYPTVEFIRMAHWAVDHGADAVIGHHPHVIQGIERYRRGVIAYSLGNFLFDSYQQELPDDRTRQGLILRLDLHKNGPPRCRYRPIPVRITDQFQVEPVPRGEGRNIIMGRLDRLSRADIFSENRGFIAADRADLADKIRTLLRRPPQDILAYLAGNFFRLLRTYWRTPFQLGWRSLLNRRRRRPAAEQEHGKR